MSIPRPEKRIGYLGAALWALTLAACAGAESARGLPGGYRLIQKDEFQALYGPDGRIERLLHDRNRDGRAEAVVVYRPDGTPERGEIDTDEDGRVDRWEYFRADGTVERIDVDRNRDGKVDRTDYPR
jgi:hypothetical protein